MDPLLNRVEILIRLFNFRTDVESNESSKTIDAEENGISRTVGSQR